MERPSVWNAPSTYEKKMFVFPSSLAVLFWFCFSTVWSAEAAVFPEGSRPGPGPAFFLWSRLPGPPLPWLQTILVLNGVLSLKSCRALKRLD